MRFKSFAEMEKLVIGRFRKSRREYLLLEVPAVGNVPGGYLLIKDWGDGTEPDVLSVTLEEWLKLTNQRLQ